jgi:hypothetical protein
MASAEKRPTIETALLSLPKLIQNKQASGRPKDLDDIGHLTRENS